MKRIILLGVIGIVLALGVAAGDPPHYFGSRSVSATADTSGDTTVITGTMPMGALVLGKDGALAYAKISGPVSGDAGWGNADSCIISLITKWAGLSKVIVAETCGSLPCSLVYKLTGGSDSILWERLDIDYTIMDTISDTPSTATYRERWDVLLK